MSTLEIISRPKSVDFVDRRTSVEILAIGIQGPPGLGIEGALLTANRLSELSTTQAAQVAARQNIGVEIIECGTFN